MRRPELPRENRFSNRVYVKRQANLSAYTCDPRRRPPQFTLRSDTITCTLSVSMAQYFEAYQYLQHVFSRLRFILVTVVTALTIALAVSVILPKTYTATARIGIDPPA